MQEIVPSWNSGGSSVGRNENIAVVRTDSQHLRHTSWQRFHDVDHNLNARLRIRLQVVRRMQGVPVTSH
jgi:hypothetical protein